MRLGALTLLVAVVGTAGQAASSVAAPVEHGSERGQFALAGWVSTDQRTGEEHFRMIETSGPLTGDAVVSYAGSDSVPIVCADGTAGVRLVESSGQGTGALRVRRDLSAATLTSSLRIETVSTRLCESGVASAVSSGRRTSVSFDLSGVGHRFTETSGSFIRIPALQSSGQHTRAIVRNASGTFRVGTAAVPVVFGDFGRMTGIWHFSSRVGEAATRLRMPVSAAALRALASNETGSLRRAGAVWEHAGSDSYRGVFVGAERLRSGGTLVYVDGYTNLPELCADGSTVARETFRSGEGEGTLAVGGHSRSAEAMASIDVTTTVVDGCTGESVSTVSPNVQVGLSLAAVGTAVHSGEWLVLHNPPSGPRRVFVAWDGRSAAGRVWIGQERRSPTTWGEIGTLRWRQRVVAPG